MSDIKLFKTENGRVIELQSQSVAVEKSLQSQIEYHLDEFLGVSFLATEYSTGKTHSGRIDTLGIDENRCPVIIEYKLATNQNVVNQGVGKGVRLKCPAPEPGRSDVFTDLTRLPWGFPSYAG